MKVITIIACVWLALVVGSVAIGLLGGLVGLTFGILGVIFELVSKVVFHPAVITIAVVFLAYKIFSRQTSK